MKPFHLPPNAHRLRADEAVTEYRHGNRQHAMTLAMMAGVNSAALGGSVTDIPATIHTRAELRDEWLWGFKVGRLGSIVNDNAQGVLI